MNKYLKLVLILLTLLVFLISINHNTDIASAQDPPQTRFYAYPYHDGIEIVHWTPGLTLNVAIYENKSIYDTGGSALFTDSYLIPPEGEGWFDNIPIDPQNYIVLSDGIDLRDLVVEDVRVLGLDPLIDEVTGIAPGDSSFWVEVWNEFDDFYTIPVTALSDGTWLAEFNGLINVTDQSGAAIHLYDADGDSSSDQNLPKPPLSISADLNNNDILVHHITPNAVVSYIIYDDLNNPVADLSIPTYGETNTSLSYYQHNVVLQPNFRIEVTDESASVTEVLVLEDLIITQFEVGTSLVAGTAPSARLVFGKVYTSDYSCHFEEYAVPGDTWEVDLASACSGLIITPDLSIAIRLDELSGPSSTAFEIRVVRPSLEVSTEGDVVFGLQWGNNSLVELEIYESLNNYNNGDPPILGPLQYHTDENGFLRGDLWKYGFDLVPGMFVSAVEPSTTWQKTVELLDFTHTYDEASNFIFGFAPPNVSFALELHVENSYWFHIPVTSDEFGYWEVDFGDYIVTGFVTLLYDEDGDSISSDGGGGPSFTPWIYSNLFINSVWAVDFVPNSTITFEIFENEFSATPLTSAEALTSENGTGAIFFEDHGIDLAPGMMVKIHDVLYDSSPRTNTQILQDIQITDFNPDFNSIAGTAPPNSTLTVRAAVLNEETVTDIVIVPQDGNWSTSFDAGLNIIRVSAWFRDELNHVTAYDIREGSAVRIIGTTGGYISTPDNSVLLTIPPNALESDTSLFVNGSGTTYELNTDLGPAEAVFSVEIGPPGTTFNQPVSIDFAWEDIDNDGIVDGTSLEEPFLVIVKDGIVLTDRCENEPGCDQIANTFTFEVSSLSEFALAMLADNQSPVVYDLQISPNPVSIFENLYIGANADDVATGNSNIGSAAYSIFSNDGSLVSSGILVAEDGIFDHPFEAITNTFVLGDLIPPVDAGVYDLCMVATDSAGNVSSLVCNLLVVYDPSAGFVTGGGWIDSSSGAYKPDLSLTGKATFGFVSKYTKGAKTPIGNTEFQFKTADLDFHSDNYEWLVVNQGGSNAQFKGSGTINGMGEYKFMLWAGDDDPDTFRIKIWYEIDDTEYVVYDNGFDQAIGAGSIVIHTKKN